MALSDMRRLAWGWLLIGLAVAIGAGLFLIAHFVFGAPVHDKYSGRLDSNAEVLGYGVLIGGGGLLFALAGRALLRWSRSRT